jgi:hypothetical protein
VAAGIGSSMSAMAMFRQLRIRTTEVQIECCREHQDIEQCQNNKQTKKLPPLRPLAHFRALHSMCPTATENELQDCENRWRYCVKKQLLAE